MKFLLRPLCWAKGHRRGKLVAHKTLVRNKDGGFGEAKCYACPRCGRETRYKIQPPAPNGTTPGDHDE